MTTTSIRQMLIIALTLPAMVIALFFTPNAAHADPVMDRINKSDKIRCGYVSYSPASQTNLNTGKLEGYTIDIMTEMGKRMGLDIEWTTETNWPVISTDMNHGKFDMGCVTYWNSPSTGRHILYTTPLFYQPVFFVARYDDTRFDADVTIANDPAYKIVVLDGDVPQDSVKQLYPKANMLSLPQSAAFSQVYQEIVSGRADLSITSISDALEFETHNPKKIKIITDQPIRIFPASIILPAGAHDLQNAVNAAVTQMHLDGTIERILKKYVRYPHEYYLPKIGYNDLMPITQE